MHSAFVSQSAINALAFYEGDDFLETSDSRGIRRKDFDLPALAFRITGVHPENVGYEQRGFVAACSGADFEDDVSLVVRVFGNEEKLEAVAAIG